MTVADLIRELQQHAPHKTVRILIEDVGPEFVAPYDASGEADVVTYEGSHVEIRAR